MGASAPVLKGTIMSNTKPIGVAYSDPALDDAQFTLYTVAQLPTASAALAGTRSAVSNSNAAYSGNAGATVAGGGSNIVPVFCNGTNWVIG
jgi:hypothetical protein